MAEAFVEFGSPSGPSNVCLYVWRNVHQLLVPGIFMFVAGIIKYGERTMALMYGNLQNISGYSTSEESKLNHPELDQDASYSSIVSFSLDSAPIV